MKAPSIDDALRARRARRDRRRRQAVLRALRKDAKPDGWYSFDQGGVHFVGADQRAELQARRPAAIRRGAARLAEKDLKGRGASTPIVVFAHMPLWPIYRNGAGATEDGAQALAYLKRFGSVTVLNGHIHQVVQKVEGNVTFHTAMSTAFPQPAPVKAEPGADARCRPTSSNRARHPRDRHRPHEPPPVSRRDRWPVARSAIVMARRAIPAAARIAAGQHRTPVARPGQQQVGYCGCDRDPAALRSLRRT